MLRLFLLTLAVFLSNASADPQFSSLYTFENEPEKPKWLPQNDGVMGGVSKETGEIKNGRLIFKGDLSLENNGGFASLQTQDANWNLTGTEGFKLRVKGDGRTYQFRVATTAKHRGSRIDYAADFETKDGKWIEVTIPVDEMKPTWRGRRLDGPELDLKNITQLRIFLGDKTPGPFLLSIDWIATEP